MAAGIAMPSVCDVSVLRRSDATERCFRCGTLNDDAISSSTYLKGEMYKKPQRSLVAHF